MSFVIYFLPRMPSADFRIEEKSMPILKNNDPYKLLPDALITYIIQGR